MTVGISVAAAGTGAVFVVAAAAAALMAFVLTPGHRAT
jgi:hypothetical protein